MTMAKDEESVFISDVAGMGLKVRDDKETRFLVDRSFLLIE